MKVYLVNPPAAGGVKMVREGRCMQRKGAWTTVWPPVTLATMAGMLQREGVEVRLDDCIVEDITFAGLESRIADFKPDLLVINTATASIFSDLSCAKIARDAWPAAKTLAFGLHVTVLPEEAFSREPCLDYLIRGEAEFCLVELVSALRANTGLEGIKGLSFRHSGAIRHNPGRMFEDDLNSVTFPAWELVDVRRYPMPLSGEPFLLVTTSKGCPHRCIFCPAKPFYGAKLRLRRPEAAVDEMAYDRDKFGVRQFLIWSESFTEDRDYVMKFCDEIIRRNLGVGWVCNSRVDKVDPDALKKMRQAGCWMIGYGVESGSQQILDSAKKDTTVRMIEQAIRWAKEAGLEVTAHVIFGLPGETIQTGLNTIRWLKAQDIDYAQIYCAVPWPSTLLYSMAQGNGWLTSRDWGFYEQNQSVLDIKTISPKQVEYLRRKAMREFYLSPKRIIPILKKINSPRKLGVFIEMAREFSSWI